jgi:2-hydroxychromene-2-carboxylate isomerase
VGVVISLDERRRSRVPDLVRVVAPREAEFAFDLCSAWTYLAVERVDRLFAAVRWTPVLLPASVRSARSECRKDVAARALALRMPLVWPDRHPVAGRGAMRAAAYAAEQRRAAAFVLAAGRLAYCGGFDLDDPEILAEAAAAAGLSLEGCLRAAGDPRRDAAMQRAGQALLAAGAVRLPVLRVGGVLFGGEEQVGAAAAAARAACAQDAAPRLGSPSPAS